MEEIVASIKIIPNYFDKKTKTFKPQSIVGIRVNFNLQILNHNKVQFYIDVIKTGVYDKSIHSKNLLPLSNKIDTIESNLFLNNDICEFIYKLSESHSDVELKISKWLEENVLNHLK